MPLNTVGPQKAQLHAYTSSKQGVSRIFTAKMLTHSVALGVWDVGLKAWRRSSQWRLSALQISTGGPMEVREERGRERRLGREEEEKKEKL